MHHSLLVATLAVDENPWVLQLRFQKCLPQPGEVAVPENAKTALYQTMFTPIAFGELLG
jgi:hypothetical protein